MKKPATRFTFVVFLIITLLLLTSCDHEHQFGPWTQEKDATCTEAGLRVRLCECGKKETQTIPQLAHCEGPWITVTEPTCTADGVKHQICTSCQLTLRIAAIDMLMHAEGQWVVDREPTSTADGSKRLICGRCDATLQTETIPATPAYLVILDAGHGGNDRGAEVEYAIEKQINLQVAFKLKALLEARGVSVVMTRQEDVYLSLEDRAACANEYDADLFISVHCNFYDENILVRGFEVYYYQNKQAKSFADAILNDLKSTGQFKTRNVKSASYYVLKNTQMPAILLEMGFLTNEQDRQDLCNEDYQQALAETIADAVVAALEKQP